MTVRSISLRGWGRLPNAVREAAAGYLFISPWLLGFVAFSLMPILAVFYLGFTDYDIVGRATWAGLANYRKAALEDPLSRLALSNTFYYVGLRVPVHIALGLGLAMLLNCKLPGIHIFRAAIYLPSVLPIVGAAVIWAWILSPRMGVLNQLLDMVGLSGSNWLGREALAKPTMVFISLYHVGTIMMIFLAGLQNIPLHLYEAAEIDGASSFQRLWSVTIPMMTPTIFLNLVMDIINSFQVIIYALLLTQGGPVNSTLFLVLYIYRSAFQLFEMGYASTLATVLFLIIVALTLPLFWTSDTWVQYEQV
jgi:multiple sugar transport system permease protein